MMFNTIFVVSVFVFIIAVVKSIFEIQAFFNQLSKAHPKLWKELGEPKWRIHFGESSFREAVKQIRSHKFASLNDKELERIYKVIKRTDKVAVFSALAAVGVTLYQALILSV